MKPAAIWVSNTFAQVRPICRRTGSNVLLAGVHDFLDRSVSQQFPEGRQVESRERVDENDTLGSSDLDQAELGQVGQLANELAVVSEGSDRSQVGDQLVEATLPVDHLGFPGRDAGVLREVQVGAGLGLGVGIFMAAGTVLARAWRTRFRFPEGSAESAISCAFNKLPLFGKPLLL